MNKVRSILSSLRSDDLLRHTVLLFAATMVASVCNVGYQMVVSRALSPEDYSLLATFLSLLAILARPLGTLNAAVTHYTSLLMKEERQDTVRGLVRKWILISGIPAIFCSVICIIFSVPIARAFNLSRIAPVVVFSAALPALFLAPVIGGALRGMQRFKWLATASILGAVGRVSIGAGFVLLLYPACGWALLGHVGGAYFNLIIMLVALLALISRFPAGQNELPSFRLYLAKCFFINFSMALLMNGDVVFVKYFLPLETDFAKAATLGRIVVFLTAAVTTAMFPKVSSSGEFSMEHRRIYLRGLSYTVLFIGCSLLVCYFVPHVLHRFLFRVLEPSADLISQTRWMAVVMGISVLAGINISLLLAQRRFNVASVAVVCAMIYCLGIWLFHDSVLSIIAVAGVTNLISLVVTTAVILRKDNNGGLGASSSDCDEDVR